MFGGKNRSTILSMKTLTSLLVLLLLPTAVLAEEDEAPVYGNPYEAECREELDIPPGEVRPGPTKGKLRRCLRVKAADARRSGVHDRSSRKNVTNAQREIQKQIEERLPEVQSTETLIPKKTTGQMLDQICREELGLLNQTLRPGPLKEKLIRCVRLKSANQRKENDIRRKRSTVERRQSTLLDKVKEIEKVKEEKAQMQRADRTKRRIQSQPRIDPGAFQEIRDNARVRTDFARKRGLRSRTVKRNNAANCRRVPASEWAKCIREALGGQTE